MKIQLNSINFYDNISPQDEIIDSMDNSTKLIPIGKSGIHIKKKNRGKFTSYCGGEVTDACIQKGKNSSNPAIRKRATFADNARHWAKKHQTGGKVDLSKLFIDVDNPTEFEYARINSNYDDLFFDEPLISTHQKPVTTKSVTPQYQIPEFLANPRSLGDVPETPEKPVSTVNNNPILKYIQPHLGKPYRVGNYDCSNFVSRIIKDMGYKLYGNCRTLYNGTSRIDMSNIKPGDLIFLQNTQPGKVGKGLASHVAMVTNTDKLKDGIVEVAHNGRTGGVSNITEWNLNSGFYHDHLLGAGRLIQQGKNGMKFFQLGGTLPFIGVSDAFKDVDEIPSFERNYYLQQDFDEPITFEEPQKKENAKEEYSIPSFLMTPREIAARPSSTPVSTSTKKYSGNNYEVFNNNLNQYIKEHPDANKYKNLLTDIAKHESNFNHSIQNTAGAPAYGYFQFWQDGRINNITKYSGLTIEDFRNNPKAQIEAAVKMAKSIENQFNSEDLRIAKAKGYNMNQLIRGAWLGGVGGVRKVLRDQGDPSDNKWYKNGKGRSVKQAMDEQV